ncbi:hypothetical protein [Acutalibacter intestini]|uniref:hypothetical protein n=1 Tax=Acutalibacter intestini TaxID=3093659 RepID=UPI002AC8DA1D|nr:hypothetical protein [Acutalibacter sp. M00204]
MGDRRQPNQRADNLFLPAERETASLPFGLKEWRKNQAGKAAFLNTITEARHTIAAQQPDGMGKWSGPLAEVCHRDATISTG